jgi:hypothetical protein
MWAYALVDPKVYATPYLIGLIVCILVFSALLLKFRSHWSGHKKSIFTGYAVVALVAGVLVYQAYDTGLGPTHIGYDFTLTTDTFKPDAVNQFNITSGNNGLRAANYQIVLNAVNASFTEDNPTEYIRVDNSTIRIPFDFNQAKPATMSKQVFFKIDTNATGFSIHTGLEAAPDSKLVVTIWTDKMQANFNPSLDSYKPEQMYKSAV